MIKIKNNAAEVNGKRMGLYDFIVYAYERLQPLEAFLQIDNTYRHKYRIVKDVATTGAARLRTDNLPYVASLAQFLIEDNASLLR